MVFFFFLSVATVQFQFNQYFVNETDGSVRVAVILTGAVDESVTVRYDIYQLLK
jgi:HSP20 family molecular chaperone IbpA